MAGIKTKFGEKLCHTKRILLPHFQNKCKSRYILNMKKMSEAIIAARGVYVCYKFSKILVKGSCKQLMEYIVPY